MLRLLLALVVNFLLLVLHPFRLWRSRRAAQPMGWVHLVIDGPVLDLPRPRKHWTELLKSRGQKHEVSLVRLAEALEALASDPGAKGLLVTLRSVGGGAATLRSLGEQLTALRGRGKHVIAYLPWGASLRELTVAASADAIWLDPAASIAPLGMAATLPYVKPGLARLGIEAEVFARGRYKTAAEGFVRSHMSDEQREQLDALLGDLFEDALTRLTEGRHVDRARAESWIGGSPWAALDARAQGIVDELVPDQELAERVANFASLPATAPRAPDARRPLRSPEPVGIGQYVRRRRIRFMRWRQPEYLAVVDVHGPIVTEGRPGAEIAAERPTVQALERARCDRRARAVVLHIDSRGGSALASTRIWRAVRRVCADKPVVAYFGDVAASGGYMIGVGAQVIVAQPVTLTGSIGVVAAKPVAAGLLDQLGVRLETVKRGERVDMFSPARSLHEGERAAFARELDVTYDEFLRIVAEGRRQSVDEVRAKAEGRVWSGRAAQREGLVDRLGHFGVALEEARARVGARGESLLPQRVRAASLGGAMLGAPGLASRVLALGGLWAVSRGVALDTGPWRGAGAWIEVLGESWLLAEQGCRVALHCGVALD